MQRRCCTPGSASSGTRIDSQPRRGINKLLATLCALVRAFGARCGRYVHDYSLLFGASTTEAQSWYSYTPAAPPAGQCYTVHAAHNFFMARTSTLRAYPWHHKMSIFEHEHFFFQLYLAKQKGVLQRLTSANQP